MEHPTQLLAAAFPTVAQADRVVTLLKKAGFATDELAIVCPPDIPEHAVGNMDAKRPSGNLAPVTTVAGAVAGVIGGVTLGLVMGPAFLGPLLIGGGAGGAIVGAMASRGLEDETTDFHDQALARDTILVAVRLKESDAARLQQAEKIFELAGSTPVPLAEQT